MRLTFENFQLTIFDHANNTAFIRISPNHGEALKKERRKLYIVYYDQEVLYVGEAGSSILTRFQRGCTAFNYRVKNGLNRRGYQGYKWLDKENNPIRVLNVFLIIFPETYDNNRDFIEAIEGELVYLIRNRIGYWPKFQNEIHFSNCEVAKKVAVKIFEEVFNVELI